MQFYPRLLLSFKGATAFSSFPMFVGELGTNVLFDEALKVLSSAQLGPFLLFYFQLWFLSNASLNTANAFRCFWAVR